jgi:hypothetical protein
VTKTDTFLMFGVALFVGWCLARGPVGAPKGVTVH